MTAIAGLEMSSIDLPFPQGYMLAVIQKNTVIFESVYVGTTYFP
jgi:hypothetical protein